ncbi:outer membrane protein [Nitrospirillum iridis]|uniref:Outer membrane immunogenic protein n=1 Tax=Nitrospirillum iridis TaxID=765888 RepID=A0A7X0B5B8_9PROT|nr:porin family protein [Nitrospirillum iridis]MBB6254935.1 outer membrane immunogenic protein [Nitrospirillum iridis]
MSHLRTLVLAASALVAVAATPALAQSTFDGGYVGANAGYDWFGAHPRAKVAGQQSTPDNQAQGFNGGIFGGYGQTFDNIYLGGEGEVNFYTADRTFGDALGNYRVQPDYGFGVSARVGYVVQPDLLLFGRVGWQHTNVDFNTIQPGSAGVPQRYSQEFDGVRYGVGGDYAIDEHLFTRIEYDYTDYSHTSRTLAAGEVRNMPDESLVRVGLGLRF